MSCLSIGVHQNLGFDNQIEDLVGKMEPEKWTAWVNAYGAPGLQGVRVEFRNSGQPQPQLRHCGDKKAFFSYF
jgi:hypothetical protein